MRLLKHIKLAGFTGLILGILFGTIDIIARIIALNFEWFEFYQTLLTSSVICILIFIIISLFVHLFIKITRLDISKKNLLIFYSASSVSLVLLVYWWIISKHYLFMNLGFWNPIRFVINLIFILIVGLIYILLLTRGKRKIYNIILFTKEKNVKNFIFMVIIFIIISFLTDLYLLNHSPKFSSNEELEYPNILLIVSETLRAEHLSLYNYRLNTTSNIDKLAENAVVFENAISPSSWTLPSLGSIFTGKYPFHHNVIKTHQKLDNKEITLAEILKRKGYNTAGFVGNWYVKAKYGFGQGFTIYKDRIDFFENAGFNKFNIVTYIDRFFPIKKFMNIDKERTSKEVNKDVFKWLDNNKEPFFLFMFYYDPRAPYNLGEEFRKQFTNETRDYKEVEKVVWGTIFGRRYENISKDIIDYIVSIYNTEIFYLDYNLGKLFNKLDELGVKNNTIIIFTADHGEEFYDHGGFQHSRTLYEEVIHVPLLIYYPKELKAQRIEKRVGTINIFPTILDIIGTEIPKDIDSISLLPLMKNGIFDKAYVFSQFYGRAKYDETTQKAITYKNWKLIEVTPEKEITPPSLFNLEKDPKEQNNLYNVEVDRREKLQKLMDEITKE